MSARELDKPILLSVVGKAATITLNRPARHNSLVPELLDSLLDALAQYAADSSVQVILLRANGESFSTGGDIHAFCQHGEDLADYADRLVGQLNEAICRMIECPKPIVVAVHGQVCGGAIGLVLAADIVVATPGASFTPYYVDVGFSPDGGWTALLPDVIGRTRASSLQQLNQALTASQAMDWGLITQLVEAEKFDTTLANICDRLGSKIPGSQASTKRLLRPRDYRVRLDEERKRFVERLESDEARAGMNAFQAAMGSKRAR